MPAARGRSAGSRLTGLVARLRKAYGVTTAPAPTDAYRLLLWEQVAYLKDDATRLAAWKKLEKDVGTSPAEILRAPMSALRAVTRAGGPIAFPLRAERLRQIAGRVFDKWDGKAKYPAKLALGDAVKELSRFHGIAKAGAERILLLSGSHAVLGLESNSVRVLRRLGYGTDDKDWNRMYDAVQADATRELPATRSARRNAFLLLRRHGQETCKSSSPRCERCPLAVDCPTGRARKS